jgi:hypothetical protein
LADLVDHLIRFESALTLADFEAAREAIVAFAAVVSTVAPFQFEYRPPNWEDVLTTWFTGQAIAQIADAEGTAVAFIQNDVVFRMVWAAEAVRVHAGVREVQGADQLLGRSALILTYGLPSVAAALLAQSGLPSRRVIMRVLETVAATFTEPEEIAEWVRGAQLPPDFWHAEPIDGDVWREFVARWTDRDRATWETWQEVFDIAWDEGLAIPPGQQVAVVSDLDRGVVRVCTLDGQPRGRLTAAAATVPDAAILAASVQDRGRVVIEFFGAGAARQH